MYVALKKHIEDLRQKIAIKFSPNQGYFSLVFRGREFHN